METIVPCTSRVIILTREELVEYVKNGLIGPVRDIVKDYMNGEIEKDYFDFYYKMQDWPIKKLIEHFNDFCEDVVNTFKEVHPSITNIFVKINDEHGNEDILWVQEVPTDH